MSDGIAEYYRQKAEDARRTWQELLLAKQRTQLAQTRYDLLGTPDTHNAWLEARRLERKAERAHDLAAYTGD
jgi:hypothetical protein